MKLNLPNDIRKLSTHFASFNYIPNKKYVNRLNGTNYLIDISFFRLIDNGWKVLNYENKFT